MTAIVAIFLSFAFLLTVYWLCAWAIDSLSLLREAKRARKDYAGAAGLARDRRRLDAAVQIGSWRR